MAIARRDRKQTGKHREAGRPSRVHFRRFALESFLIYRFGVQPTAAHKLPSRARAQYFDQVLAKLQPSARPRNTEFTGLIDFKYETPT
jgi:hypothetical protein